MRCSGHVLATFGFLAFAGVTSARAEVFFCSATGHYYQAVPEGAAYRSWFAAQAEAEAMTFAGVQGRLATIESAEENACIAANIPLPTAPAGLWVGGFQDPGAGDYAEPAGGWYWGTGEGFAYTNWWTGQPDNDTLHGDENCLTIGGAGFQWNDLWCDVPGDPARSGILVEFDTEVFFCSVTGHYYQVVPESAEYRSWFAAQGEAEAMSFAGVQGRLATIESAEENDCFAANITLPMAPAGLWLGGFQDPDAPDYAEPAGGWYWNTGEAFAYTNWETGSGQPDNDTLHGDENCLTIGGIFQWNDLWCDVPGDPARSGFVVEYDGAPIPAVSEWGMAVATLLLLTAGTLTLRNRMRAA